jgi:hypothetical protein
MIDRLVAPLLLLGCVVLGVILIFEINEPDRMAMAPHLLEEQAAPLPALRQLARLPVAPPIAAILARPLFSPSRRPPQNSTGNAADDAGLADSRLAGIVIEPGRRFAIFAPQGAKPLMVTEGETVSGWRVDSISPQEVSLSGPEGTKTLQPKFDPNLAPPAEEQTPPPAPVFGVPPNIRAAPGVMVPQPGAPVFIPGQSRFRQLRRQ